MAPLTNLRSSMAQHATGPRGRQLSRPRRACGSGLHPYGPNDCARRPRRRGQPRHDHRPARRPRPHRLRLVARFIAAEAPFLPHPPTKSQSRSMALDEGPLIVARRVSLAVSCCYSGFADRMFRTWSNAVVTHRIESASARINTATAAVLVIHSFSAPCSSIMWATR
jgi:hypothetical protein